MFSFSSRLHDESNNISNDWGSASIPILGSYTWYSHGSVSQDWSVSHGLFMQDPAVKFPRIFVGKLYIDNIPLL